MVLSFRIFIYITIFHVHHLLMLAELWEEGGGWEEEENHWESPCDLATPPSHSTATAELEMQASLVSYCTSIKNQNMSPVEGLGSGGPTNKFNSNTELCEVYSFLVSRQLTQCYQSAIASFSSIVEGAFSDRAILRQGTSQFPNQGQPQIVLCRGPKSTVFHGVPKQGEAHTMTPAHIPQGTISLTTAVIFLIYTKMNWSTKWCIRYHTPPK